MEPFFAISYNERDLSTFCALSLFYEQMHFLFVNISHMTEITKYNKEEIKKCLRFWRQRAEINESACIETTNIARTAISIHC